MDKGYKPQPKVPYKTIQSYEFRKTTKDDNITSIASREPIEVDRNPFSKRTTVVPATYEVCNMTHGNIFIVYRYDFSLWQFRPKIIHHKNDHLSSKVRTKPTMKSTQDDLPS